MREQCNEVMTELMEAGSFTKEDFYRGIRPHAEDPKQIIALWEQTRNDYLEAGWIESDRWGTYRKAEEPAEPTEASEPDESQSLAE